MPQTIRFHLDENVNRAIADGLKRRSIDVTTTPEIGMIGASDEQQLQFARSQQRVLFTQDADFLRLNTAGQEHAGIVFCAKESRSVGEILQGLVLIWEVLEASEMINHVEFL